MTTWGLLALLVLAIYLVWEWRNLSAWRKRLRRWLREKMEGRRWQTLNREIQAGNLEIAEQGCRRLLSAGSVWKQALGWGALALVREKQGKTERAFEMRERAIELHRAIDNEEGVRSVTLGQVEMLRRADRTVEARSLLLGVIPGFSRCPDPFFEAQFQRLLALCEGEQGDTDAARSHSLRAIELFESVGESLRADLTREELAHGLRVKAQAVGELSGKGSAKRPRG